ncbi:DUF4262 domain-containing protein [Promicromonospora sp. CA-289599]|uniref:DUF4262 domain-containing protein n=1 Tax=Promicromonospora sp. CA-289599 TaxID=3240014 RepID=UPI003D8BAD81
MTSEVELKLVHDVEKHGFSVLWVFDDEGDAPDFAYTVGLTVSISHPEFVVAGLPHGVSTQILTEVAGRVVDGLVVHEGDRLAGVLENFDVLIAGVQQAFIRDNMRHATEFAGKSSLSALQILWPDRAGLFPTEPSFDTRLAGRQVLG